MFPPGRRRHERRPSRRGFTGRRRSASSKAVPRHAVSLLVKAGRASPPSGFPVARGPKSWRLLTITVPFTTGGAGGGPDRPWRWVGLRDRRARSGKHGSRPSQAGIPGDAAGNHAGAGDSPHFRRGDQRVPCRLGRLADRHRHCAGPDLPREDHRRRPFRGAFGGPGDGMDHRPPAGPVYRRAPCRGTLAMAAGLATLRILQGECGH